MNDRQIKRGRFLTMGVTLMGVVALFAAWPFKRAHSKSCPKMEISEGNNDPHKFLRAFTNGKIKGLPENPVTY